jgi:hypothetical protein
MYPSCGGINGGINQKNQRKQKRKKTRIPLWEAGRPGYSQANDLHRFHTKKPQLALRLFRTMVAETGFEPVTFGL